MKNNCLNVQSIMLDRNTSQRMPLALSVLFLLLELQPIVVPWIVNQNMDIWFLHNIYKMPVFVVSQHLCFRLGKYSTVVFSLNPKCLSLKGFEPAASSVRDKDAITVLAHDTGERTNV